MTKLDKLVETAQLSGKPEDWMRIVLELVSEVDNLRSRVRLLETYRPIKRWPSPYDAGRRW